MLHKLTLLNYIFGRKGWQISRPLKDFPNKAKLFLSTRFIINNAIRLRKNARTSYEPTNPTLQLFTLLGLGTFWFLITLLQLKMIVLSLSDLERLFTPAALFGACFILMSS